MGIDIRLARELDLAAINAIYNHYVATSTCTWQEEAETDEGRRAWFAGHGRGHPVTVAVAENGDVVGWGALNPMHARSGWRFTVENSVYVHHAWHRRGVGRALLVDLMERARDLGHRSIVAVISGDQEGSIALHRRAGFVEAGRLKNAGFKFGRWMDGVYLQWEVA